MKLVDTPISDVYIVEYSRFSDQRGFFVRKFCRESLANFSINFNMRQSNLSLTIEPGTVRGMHLQTGQNAENKLVSCVSGRIFDVCVDLRPESKTFGQYFAVELDGNSNKSLLVPKGCAHGFQALEHNSIVQYFVDADYAPNCESGLNYADPSVNIRWPLKPINVSEKDKILPFLSNQ